MRKAIREGRWDLIFAMVPAVDGGQSYEMKCSVCDWSGNILASKFTHKAGCLVEAVQNADRRRRLRWTKRKQE